MILANGGWKMKRRKGNWVNGIPYPVGDVERRQSPTYLTFNFVCVAMSRDENAILLVTRYPPGVAVPTAG
jgi:hypothetical protein